MAITGGALMAAMIVKVAPHCGHGAMIDYPLEPRGKAQAHRRRNPVPIGVAGELHVGGAGLARGYLNAPELFAERFIANPFSKPGTRLYKTGDFARFLADGNIEFLGRIDHQIKIRGYRIEPGEIETALNRHPDIRSCAVIAREEEPDDKRLVAYVVASEEAAPSNADLRAHLKQSFPDHMLPSAFVVLDQLPVSANGKLDRNALPAPEYRSEAVYAAPRTPNEATLAKIFGEILKLDRVGIHDNFFNLGGHSLLATQLISRIRSAFAIDLPLRAVFEAPTIAGLAFIVIETQANGLEPENMADLLAELERVTAERSTPGDSFSPRASEA